MINSTNHRKAPKYRRGILNKSAEDIIYSTSLRVGMMLIEDLVNSAIFILSFLCFCFVLTIPNVRALYAQLTPLSLRNILNFFFGTQFYHRRFEPMLCSIRESDSN